jgi:hypothetical protein
MTLFKLLVVSPQDKQEIVEVEESGGYYDESKVLWDERKHGLLPEITLGAMVVQEVDGARTLSIDPELLAQVQAQAIIEAKAQALAECRALRAKDYPSIGDQLDAQYKARQGNSADLELIDAQIAAVKAKYPKPQA